MRNKSLLLVLACLGALVSSCVAQAKEPQVLNRTFASGGILRLMLQAGDYEIRPSREDKIHVEWTANESKLDKVKVNLTTNGTAASLIVKTPNNGNVHVIIEVPLKSNMVVRLTAGELRVGDIEGSKDIESHVGDVDIDVGDPSAYGPIDASVNIGDLKGDAFNVSKDGFHNRFQRNGGGKYRLHAHVGVGDLKLTKGSGPA